MSTLDEVHAWMSATGRRAFENAVRDFGSRPRPKSEWRGVDYISSPEAACRTRPDGIAARQRLAVAKSSASFQK